MTISSSEIKKNMTLIIDGELYQVVEWQHRKPPKAPPTLTLRVKSIKNGNIDLVINTPMGARSRFDEEAIGRACIQHGILAITTLSGASAALRAIRSVEKAMEIDSIQNYHT